MLEERVAWWGPMQWVGLFGPFLGGLWRVLAEWIHVLCATNSLAVVLVVGLGFLVGPYGGVYVCFARHVIPVVW